MGPRTDDGPSKLLHLLLNRPSAEHISRSCAAVGHRRVPTGATTSGCLITDGCLRYRPRPVLPRAPVYRQMPAYRHFVRQYTGCSGEEQYDAYFCTMLHCTKIHPSRPVFITTPRGGNSSKIHVHSGNFIRQGVYDRQQAHQQHRENSVLRYTL